VICLNLYVCPSLYPVGLFVCLYLSFSLFLSVSNCLCLSLYLFLSLSMSLSLCRLVSFSLSSSLYNPIFNIHFFFQTPAATATSLVPPQAWSPTPTTSWILGNRQSVSSNKKTLPCPCQQLQQQRPFTLKHLLQQQLLIA
jgi:hypothetical protein